MSYWIQFGNKGYNGGVFKKEIAFRYEKMASCVIRKDTVMKKSFPMHQNLAFNINFLHIHSFKWEIPSRWE